MEELAEVQESEELAAPPSDTSTSPDDPVEAPESISTEAIDDDEEIDHDGEKFKVPKKLKDAFLRHQDYTQKTQAVAEQRREVETRQQALVQQAQAQQANLAAYAEVFNIDNQLQQFAQVNWNALIDADPVQAMKLDRQMNELKQRREGVVSAITQKQQQDSINVQRENAKRMEAGLSVLSREIKNWSPDTAKALKSYGQEFGYAPEELNNINDPRAVKLLHKAWQFDQLMKKQAINKPAPQEKPVTRISASAGTATKDPSRMTDAEFAAMRRRQIAQRK